VSAHQLAAAVFRHIDAWWALVDPFDKPYLGQPRLLALLDACGRAVQAGDVAATETACRAYIAALKGQN